MTSNFRDFFRVNISNKNKKIFVILKKIFSYVFTIFLLFYFYFHFNENFNLEKFSQFYNEKKFLYIAVLSIFLNSFAIIFGIISFKILTKIFKKKLTKSFFLELVNVQAFKYLPSNMIQYLGRFYTLKKNNISNKEIFILHLLEILILISVLILIIAITSKFYYLSIFPLFFFFFRFRYRSEIVTSIFFILLAYCFLAMIFYINTKYLLNLQIYFLDCLKFYSISFTISLFIPGPPAGIGTREFMTLFFFKDIINLEVLSIIILLMRFYSFVSDIFLYVVSKFLLYYFK